MTTYEASVARAKAKLCRECGRKLGARAIFLFLVPGDFRVSVCGPRCFQRYSDGPDLTREAEPPMEPEPEPEPGPPPKTLGIEDLI